MSLFTSHLSPLTLISLLAVGFLFGVRHAFDADHIAAISSLSVGGEKSSDVMRRGIFWALGHTLALFALAIVMHVLGGSLSADFSMFFEKIAAIILLILGVHSLVNFFSSREKIGAHMVHFHPPMGLHAHPNPSFFVGLIHGAAGSAAALLITLGALQSLVHSLIYIAALSLGVTFGMMLACLGLSIALKHVRSRAALLTGLFSVAIGAVMFF